MKFDEQIVEASKRIKDPDFIELHATINDESKTLDVELIDGFNHTWFYETYDYPNDKNSTKEAILDKIMEDTQKFDIFGELATSLQVGVPGMPCVRTMCKIAFSLEHFTNELYWKLSELYSEICYSSHE